MLKILAVDDNQVMLDLISMMSARLGFNDLSTALSGEKAITTIVESKINFDCFFLDISMPDMDGIELCGLIRKIPDYEKTPIIMLTAMSEKSYIDSAFKAGATDYANKPFNIVELQARLQITQEIVTARKVFVSGSSYTEAQEMEPQRTKTIDPIDDVKIEGIKPLIACSALTNYLSQLSNAGVASSQVSAIKIDQFSCIYSKASSDELFYALTEVSEAVNSALSINGYLMAYGGNGNFLVVSSKMALELSVDLETEIQNLLDELDTRYDNGTPLDLDVSVGYPIQLGAKGTQNQTIDRAIARAESRCVEKKTEPKRHNIRRVNI